VSWTRALATGVVVVAVAFVLLVIVPDQLLTQLSGLDRSARVAVATAWFVIAVTAMLWTLRRLQRHQTI
jgi:multisubunit Na+/H+ antiporter MnhB subunit